MVMITGGAYQGKRDFVISTYNIKERDIVDGKECTIEEAKKAQCLINYHELVKRLGDECIAFTESICRTGTVSIIVIDEIGCGIIPLEKTERIWRENVGRCGCIIASKSESVVRIVSGIPVYIKESIS